MGSPGTPGFWDGPGEVHLWTKTAEAAQLWTGGQDDWRRDGYVVENPADLLEQPLPPQHLTSHPAPGPSIVTLTGVSRTVTEVQLAMLISEANIGFQQVHVYTSCTCSLCSHPKAHAADCTCAPKCLDPDTHVTWAIFVFKNPLAAEFGFQEIRYNLLNTLQHLHWMPRTLAVQHSNPRVLLPPAECQKRIKWWNDVANDLIPAEGDEGPPPPPPEEYPQEKPPLWAGSEYAKRWADILASGCLSKSSIAAGSSGAVSLPKEAPAKTADAVVGQHTNKPGRIELHAKQPVIATTTMRRCDPLTVLFEGTAAELPVQVASRSAVAAPSIVVPTSESGSEDVQLPDIDPDMSPEEILAGYGSSPVTSGQKMQQTPDLFAGAAPPVAIINPEHGKKRKANKLAADTNVKGQAPSSGVKRQRTESLLKLNPQGRNSAANGLPFARVRARKERGKQFAKIVGRRKQRSTPGHISGAANSMRASQETQSQAAEIAARKQSKAPANSTGPAKRRRGPMQPRPGSLAQPCTNAAPPWSDPRRRRVGRQGPQQNGQSKPAKLDPVRMPQASAAEQQSRDRKGGYLKPGNLTEQAPENAGSFSGAATGRPWSAPFPSTVGAQAVQGPRFWREPSLLPPSLMSTSPAPGHYLPSVQPQQEWRRPSGTGQLLVERLPPPNISQHLRLDDFPPGFGLDF